MNDPLTLKPHQIRWIDAWKSNNTPWDLHTPHPATRYLLNCALKSPFVKKHITTDTNSLTVNIPGAGSANDAKVFLQSGFIVNALDISHTASIIANNTYINFKIKKKFNYLVTDAITELPKYPADIIFDRAMFCALEPFERDNYLQSIVCSLKDNGVFLAILFAKTDNSDFQENLQTPPYIFDFNQIKKMMSKYFKLDMIEYCLFTNKQSLYQEYLLIASKSLF